MTTTAQYASVARSGLAQVTAANTNKDGTGSVAVVLQAGATGARVDGIAIKAAGTTTAGMVRFYLTKGRPLGTISSITFTGTTAIVTTALAHGLTTGNLVTAIGNLPDDYNVSEAAVTVTAATTFTYVMATTPTTNATVIGFMATTPATVQSRMFLEKAVSAITPSATVVSFTDVAGSANSGDKCLFPLVLQAGWSLRASTEKAETFNIIPMFAGDFS
jgi:hypothetical protein